MSGGGVCVLVAWGSGVSSTSPEAGLLRRGCVNGMVFWIEWGMVMEAYAAALMSWDVVSSLPVEGDQWEPVGIFLSTLMGESG